MTTTTTMNKQDKLNSLRLLFSQVYSDQDLTVILEEASDDLDLAIARIAEGQAEQWDQVKNKKKEKNVGPPVRGRGAARGGRGAARGRGGRPNTNAVPKNNSFKPKEEVAIVEQKPNSATVSLVKEKENQSITNTSRPFTAPVTATTSTVFQKKTIEFKMDTWSTSPAAPIGKSKAFQKPIGSEAKQSFSNASSNNNSSKTTWAQLVKGPETVSITLIKAPQKTTPTIEKVEKKLVSAPVSAIVSPPKQPSPVQHIVPLTLSDAAPAPVKQSNLPPGLLQSTTSSNGKGVGAPNITLQKKSRPDAAVVMPTASNLSSVGVQFGSLRIANETPKEKELENPISQNSRIVSQVSTAATATASHPPTTNVGVIPPYPGMSHGSYFPQPGFGMVAGAADFSHLYGNEQQLRAASMGYYSDPYQQTGKMQAQQQQQQQVSTDSQTSQPNVTTQATAPTQGVPLQQQYPVPFGYYPYYMPNQYQNAPVSGYPYGQYVNKNVYPYAPNPQATPAAVPPSTAAPSVTKAPLNGYGTYAGYEESLNYANSNPTFQGFNSGFNATPTQGMKAAPPQEFRNPNNNNNNNNNNRNQRQSFQSNSTLQSANLSQTATNSNAPAGYYNQQAQQYYVQSQQQQVYGSYGNGQRNGQYWNGQS